MIDEWNVEILTHPVFLNLVLTDDDRPKRTGVQHTTQYLLMGGHLLLLPTAPWTIYVSLDFCAQVFNLKKPNYLP